MGMRLAGTACGCARAPNGHATAPPSPAMNFRRRILESSPRVKEGYPGEVRELRFAPGIRNP
jgi:hypothetical protein